MATEEAVNELFNEFVSRAHDLGISVQRGYMYPWGYTMFVFKNLTYNKDTKQWNIVEARSDEQSYLFDT